jgi:hypothetical protein
MKAFRWVKKTKQAPNLERFQQREPQDAAKALQRRREMAQRLKGSGQNLAGATPKIPHPGE